MKEKVNIKTILMLATLFLSTLSIMGDCVVTVVTTTLYELYPAGSVNIMIAAPGIVGLIFCPFAGRLCDKADKKIVLLIGYILYAISGIGGVLVDSTVYIIIMRCIATGVCYALTSTAALGVITDYFEDESFRGKVIGWYNASMAILGGIFSAVAGAMAVNNWKNAFASNWFAVPLIVLIIIFVPSCKPRNDVTSADKKEKVKGEKGWYRRLIPLLLAFLTVGICYYTIQYMIDLYVTDNSLGNSSFTGILGTVGTIGSFILCVSFGFIYGKFKNHSIIPSYAILAIGFFLMGFFPSVPVALISCTIMGAAWGNAYSYWWMRCTVVVPENMTGTAIGLTGTFNSLAAFPASYILLWLEKVFKTDNSADVFFVYGIACAVVFVVSLIYNRKKDAE